MLFFWRKNERPTRPDIAIVGLGNPGPEYAASRHNVGFMCIDHFAQANNIPLDNRRGNLRWGEGHLRLNDTDKHLLLARPRTFMNQSGEAVHYLCTRWRTRPEELLIIYDEMHLPLGTIRLRIRGSSAGHNGIQSVMNAVGTQEVPRIRLGIGRSTDVGNVDYVLGDFTDEEMKVVNEMITTASEAILTILTNGPEAAMSKFN